MSAQTEASLAEIQQRLADAECKAKLWQERAEFMVELANAALAVADSIFVVNSGKTASASPYACVQLQSLAAKYAIDAEKIESKVLSGS